jgi:hypothetical protein
VGDRAILRYLDQEVFTQTIALKTLILLRQQQSLKIKQIILKFCPRCDFYNFVRMWIFIETHAYSVFDIIIKMLF